MDQLIISRKFEKAAKREAILSGKAKVPAIGSRDRFIGALFVLCLSGMFFLYQKAQSDLYKFQSELDAAYKNVETKTSENKLLRGQLKDLKFEFANIEKRYNGVVQQSFAQLTENKSKISLLESTLSGLTAEQEKLQSKLALCEEQAKADVLP